ncbi:hypothetical protein EKG38_03430 [Shewanella canadensis]|uniref:Uncharacterized protein n=1 Tax=Shewanella canadensis TaxID=271096 RepID=A0A3S0IR23_9GAMM|nr:hypothetical protein [Shewanella canadensis]RTR40974.1 hypothetical protein EKG38_03430 [Shewanella canadensis]
MKRLIITAVLVCVPQLALAEKVSCTVVGESAKILHNFPAFTIDKSKGTVHSQYSSWVGEGDDSTIVRNEATGRVIRTENSEHRTQINVKFDAPAEKFPRQTVELVIMPIYRVDGANFRVTEVTYRVEPSDVEYVSHVYQANLNCFKTY